MIKITNGNDVSLPKLILVEPTQTDISLASAPTGVSATLTAGGSLADDTYYYKVSAVIKGVETTLSSEVNATTSSTNNSVTIKWLPVAYAEKYYIYKSLATGIYHQAFEVEPSQKFVDDGNREWKLKEISSATDYTDIYSTITKSEIKDVTSTWIDSNEWNPSRAIVHIYIGEKEYSFDLSDVSNHPTWVSTQAGLKIAIDEILSWL